MMCSFQKVWIIHKLSWISYLYIIIVGIHPCEVGIVEGGIFRCVSRLGPASARKCAKHCIGQQRGDLPLAERDGAVLSPPQKGNGLRHTRRQVQAYLDRVRQYSGE